MTERRKAPKPKGRGKGLEADCEAMLEASGVCWFRNEPKMNGRFKVKGGTPDYTAMAGGIGHLIECKEANGPSIRLGCLIAPADDAALPAGITPKQAEMLDGWEQQGGRGWVLARLSGKQGEVTALIPWRVWRGWLEKGVRSVPPLMLAAAGVRGDHRSDPGGIGI